jgi:hypothetical protein
MNHRRTPWYRPRNVLTALLSALVVFLGWAFYETMKVYRAQPNPHVDSRARLRTLSEQAAGVSRDEGGAAWRHLTDLLERAQGAWTDPDLDFGAVLEGPQLPEPIDAEREAIARLHERGVLERLERLAAGPPALDPLPGDGPLFLELFATDRGPSRQLAQARAASMRLALAERDFAEVTAAFDQTLALGRTEACRPFLLGYLTGQAIQALALGELRYELMEAEFPEAVCRRLLESVDLHPLPDFEFALEAERIYFHDQVQWWYSDDGEGDGYLVAAPYMPPGVGAPIRPSLLGAARSRFLWAGRAETIEAYDDLVDRMVEVHRLEPAARAGALHDVDPLLDRLSRRYDLIRLMCPAFRQALENEAVMRLRIETVRLMLALETHRAVHGRYPDGLGDLVPDFMAKLPLDPVHGAPFGYRLVEDDPHGRPYLLYVTGVDLVDDGGRELPGAGTHVSWALPLREPGFAGYDAILNPPRLAVDE